MSFEGNANYKSIDRLTQELCDEANQLVPNYGHVNRTIGIGSVYVTGHTIECRDCNISIYCFRHTSSSDDVLALLDWHCNIDGITESNETFSRVGRTPYIAKQGDDYFRELHYSNHLTNYHILPDATYRLLQLYSLDRNTGSFIGHATSNNRHDMLHFDFADIFQKERNWHYSVLYDEVNRNIWDFTLCELACAIMCKDNYKVFDAGTESLNEKFAKKVKQYEEFCKEASNKNTILKDGIAIYPADAQTKDIVESVKNVFIPSYANRIIPISALVKDRSASPLLTSPIFIENLRKLYMITQRMEK